MQKKPRILSIQEAAKTEIFRIEKIDLQFSNGEQRKYERLERVEPSLSAVMIVPITDDNQLVMMEEYSVGLETYEIGFPKGLIEKNETLFEGAERELKEEVGFGAKKMEFILNFALSPQYMSNTMNLILAHHLYPEKKIGDEPEPMKVYYFSWEEAMQMITSKIIKDIRTIAALYLIKNHLNQK